MYIIKNTTAVSQAGICQILTQRITELKLSNEGLTDVGEFIIVEAGDTISDLEKSSGCSITTSMFSDDHYGSPDFVPNHEWLEHHPAQHCFEMVFIMNDNGYFTVLLIPDDPGVDAELLSLCREYS